MTGQAPLGVEEARRRLPELISRAAAGERLVISRHQKPLAALVPLVDVDRSDQPHSQELGLLSLAGSGSHCWSDSSPHQPRGTRSSSAPTHQRKAGFDPRQLKPGTRIAFDGSALVSFCCQGGGSLSYLGPLVEGIAQGYWQGVISSVSLMGLLEGPLGCGDEALAQRYCTALTERIGWRVIAPTSAIAAAAARLRQQGPGLTPINALELATAIHCEAAVLVSDDPNVIQTDHLPVLRALRV